MSPSPTSFVARLLALVLVSVAPHQTSAEEARPSNVVEVNLGGDAGFVAQATATLRELLAPLSMDTRVVRTEHIDPAVVVTPRPDASPALLRVWIDLEAENVCTISLVERSWTQVIIRRLEHEGVDAAVLEEIGRIVASAASALLAGRPMGSALAATERPLAETSAPPAGRAPPEASAPPERPTHSDEPDAGRASRGAGASPEADEAAEAEEGSGTNDLSPEADEAAEAEEGSGTNDLSPEADEAPVEGDEDAGEEGEPSPPRSWQFGIGYGADIWSGERAPLHGVEAWIELMFRNVRLVPAVRLHLAFRFTDTVETEDVVADLSQTEVRAMAGLRLYSASTLSLRLLAGAGVDLLDVSPRWRDERSTPAGVELGEARLVAVPVVRAALELWIRFSSQIEIAVGAGVDADLTDVSFVNEREDGTQVLFDPLWARPVIYAALGWRLR